MKGNLIDCLKNEDYGSVQNESLSKIRQELQKKIKKQIEYWKTDDILDIFKSIVDDNTLIDNAKNVKRYRDWIAHKNPQKKPSANVTPQTAYRVLSCIIEELDQLSPA